MANIGQQVAFIQHDGAYWEAHLSPIRGKRTHLYSGFDVAKLTALLELKGYGVVRINTLADKLSAIRDLNTADAVARAGQ